MIKTTPRMISTTAITSAAATPPDFCRTIRMLSDKSTIPVTRTIIPMMVGTRDARIAGLKNRYIPTTSATIPPNRPTELPYTLLLPRKNAMTTTMPMMAKIAAIALQITSNAVPDQMRSTSPSAIRQAASMILLVFATRNALLTSCSTRSFFFMSFPPARQKPFARSAVTLPISLYCSL